MKEGDTNTAKAMERHQNLYLHGHVDVPGILRQPGTYFYQQRYQLQSRFQCCYLTK